MVNTPACSDSPSGGSPTVVPPIAPLSAPVDNSYVRATAVNNAGAASLLQTDDRTGSFFQPVGERSHPCPTLWWHLAVLHERNGKESGVQGS